MRRWLLLVPCALVGAVEGQVTIKTPVDSLNKPLQRAYGNPEPVELDQIAYNGETYQKRNVLTRGVLDVLVDGRYLSLRKGAAEVMIVPMDGNAYVHLKELVGRDVDLTGIVRGLPAQQSAARKCGTDSQCEDPQLPGLPDYRPGWPHVSITAFTASDRGTGMSEGRGHGRGLAETGLEAAAADGKPVRAIGQFRGSNLCRDLPETTRRAPADWVLLTSEGAVWITGRRPEGKGFRLDPADRGDTSRWLEVGGRVEAAGEVRYVKASTVALIAHPKATEGNPCAR